MPVAVVGVPIGDGAGVGGAETGPRALRAAGLREALAAQGRTILDKGDLAAVAVAAPATVGRAGALARVAAHAAAARQAAREMPADVLPLFLGGDHSLSLGTLPGLAERAARLGRPFFVLWIDAHPDCHTLQTTESGNLHGTPVAHALGASGFADGLGPWLAPVTCRLRPENLLMLGIRSVDTAEAAFIAERGIAAHGPDRLRAAGLDAALEPWLAEIRRVGGTLHVSLDADALDPAVAPGVGTPVAEGLSLEEVREVLARVAGAGVLGSLELVEVNGFLDRDQRTARAMVALAAEALRPPAAVASARRARS